MSTKNKGSIHPDSIISDNKPLKILMVDSHGSVQRGGAVQCASLAQALARRGHRLTCVFDGRPDQPLEGLWFDNLRSAGVQILRLGLDSPADMLQFRRLLATERPDILHTHKNRALFFAYFATLGMRRPVWTANRGTVYPLSLSRLAHFIHRRHVARMFAVAQAVKDALVDDGIPSKKVDVIYGSFDPERFSPAVSGQAMRNAWQVPFGTPLVGLIGSLNTPKKGHQLLLEAATILRGKCRDLRFVLVGEGDPSPLEAKASSLGVSDRVIFAGFTEDVPAALAALDIVVCASLRGEGLTGAVREALAMARPVISSDVAGNRELVRHGQTGLLVPPGDPVALAAAICRLLDDRGFAQECAVRGRELVLELCTEERRAEQVERAYCELLTAAGATPSMVERTKA
ncbi:glycosyltransferase family 4 protein [Pelobacter propionicus]|uniref:Glycosyl transferase, group 1 n=1 Tax=Pelobacter propionicus (strain DSM 2379 / NBRC 103807 / OttBd1) TaxID=338966 RepID=A1ASN1_PELPD|nr:glycosyltransferase family 4 protein [Pelobacter propionicus]ABL00352.1 glycosyl transferase, group 1 [Pelobacter propionicus DSM 2379]